MFKVIFFPHDLISDNYAKEVNVFKLVLTLQLFF